MESDIAHTTNPKHFLKSEEVKLKLLYAKENISKGVYDTHGMKLMTAFAAAILLYKSGQRSGVIENLTVDEFKLRRDDVLQKKIIIPCVHHKTGRKGCAKLVVNTMDFEHI